MHNPLSPLRAMLLVAVIAAWVGGWETPAVAKKPPPPPPAPVPETGQTQCWDASGTPISCAGTGQDGEVQAGVDWPTPRFTDKGNGTVTDNLTGLIWLKNPFCSTLSPVNWATALAYTESLAQGQCGLTDGSKAGEWRVPTVKELLSLIDYEFAVPALSNAAGTGQWTEANPFALDGLTAGGGFWSSTTCTDNPRNAWTLWIDNGHIEEFDKTVSSYVWPVRGGQ